MISVDNNAQDHEPAVSFLRVFSTDCNTQAYVVSRGYEALSPIKTLVNLGLVVECRQWLCLPAIVSAQVGCAEDLVLHEAHRAYFPFGAMNALAGAMHWLSEDRKGQMHGQRGPSRSWKFYKVASMSMH